MKILIVEDEIDLIQVVKTFLEQEKFIVETARDFESGLAKLANYTYDCVILDIMLPGGSGMELLKEIRARGKGESVIIVSAKDSVEDKIQGLELGADDYLSKPFHLLELLARIKTIIRRSNQEGESVVQFKNVSLYPEDRRVTVGTKDLQLNRKEYDLLYHFMIRPAKLVEKSSLAEAIWGDDADQSENFDFIYSQIKNLRKKLKETNAEIDFQAVYGVGYKLI